MFQSARLKLTIWYLLIIILISTLFSIVIYNTSTRELQRIIVRIQTDEQRGNIVFFQERPRPFNPPTVEELQEVKQRILVTLVIVNGVIILISGGAAYFLAGKTLKPIRHMIDEQNEFISSASHELRTPIATLRTEMEGSLLEKNISDRKARELINSNLEELGTLQELSDNLLRIAQVHNVGIIGKLESVSVVEAIKAAQKKTATLAKRKHIVILAELRELIVKGNKSELIEVFVSLFDNAIKYSTKNTKINVKVTQIGNEANISVNDEGIGISEQDLPHIFKRFYRADKSRSKADGFGLGLSIAKKVVEVHGGSISVKSDEKEGSTFIVKLPLENS